MDNLNHRDCVIVNSPSDALYFTEWWSLEILGWRYLLPRWLWKTSCWTMILKFPDSPSVWVIACISYFTFVSLWGFRCSLLFEVLLAVLRLCINQSCGRSCFTSFCQVIVAWTGVWVHTCSYIMHLVAETSWWNARVGWCICAVVKTSIGRLITYSLSG